MHSYDQEFFLFCLNPLNSLWTLSLCCFATNCLSTLRIIMGWDRGKKQLQGKVHSSNGITVYLVWTHLFQQLLSLASLREGAFSPGHPCSCYWLLNYQDRPQDWIVVTCDACTSKKRKVFSPSQQLLIAKLHINHRWLSIHIKSLAP
jgi:hypothetical protein